MARKVKVYYNKKQRYVMTVAAAVLIMVAGRRFGKSHGVNAPWWLRNTQKMPGSSGGIVGASFQQLLTRTLPATLKGLETMGYQRNVHYVIGRKPHRALNFAKPYIEPVSYDRVISWYNGSIAYLISQDIPGSSNSLTLQWIMGDEAKLLSFDKLKDETFPANGGFQGPWKDCPWLNSMLFTSDMPSGKRGSWFLSYEEKMDRDVIAYIEGLIHKIFILKRTKQTSYVKRQLAKAEKELAYWRSRAVHYVEASSIENVELLGARYIEQQKRDLPPLIFQTSIMCKRPGKLDGGFYDDFNPKDHIYTAFDNSRLLNLEYDATKIAASATDCLQDTDLQRKEPICIAFDYNAKINWLVAGQQSGSKMLVLNSFFVKGEPKLVELVDKFCDYYRHHNNRTVVFYHDQTALNKSYAIAGAVDFRGVIYDRFIENGWSVEVIYIGQAPAHKDKFLWISQAFKGQGNYLFPMINGPHNEALTLAMEMAGIRQGPKGWEKDKTGEKLAESPEDLLEYRTDATDAFDTLFVGMNQFPRNTSSIIGGALWG